LGGRLSLVEAEALGDLLRAETERERRAALSVHDGAFGEILDRWRTRLIELSARVEQLVDHSDDVVVPIGEDQRLRSHVAELAEEMQVIIDRPTRDSLRDGLTVALAGPPNAGKSSLLNVLIGRNAALVSEHAGTTRDLIEVSIVIGGRRVRLIDTAGVRDSDDPVERMGIGLARRSMDTADLLIWLGDGLAPHRRGPTLSIRARCDEPSRRAPDGRLAVSSITGEGIDDLVDWIGEAAGGNIAGEASALLNARQNSAVSTVYDELREATGQQDIILLAEHLRLARRGLNGVATPANLESVMDRLFGDFCLGK
jgi:tRNA modification GTPase